ncbi:MAG: glycosyltransferase family 4 protein [Desertifilum sp.]|nr:glycosyltransferase family 4 protein [Oscillatoria laete-virens]MCD8489536.1 glycosyltransferase family 4 protein [Desertifilum sp.]MDL5052908.1 glycosyltransferase family 4 protein [Oscillatoria laete-virens NRMC-F 0139]
MMKIGYLTTYDPFDNSTWSRHNTGLNSAGYHLAKGFESQFIDLNYLGPLDKKTYLITRLKWLFYRRLKQQDYYRWAEPFVLEDYASQISVKLANLDVDLIFCPENAIPIAALKSQKPLVLCTDSTLAGLIDFYPWLNNLCSETKKNIYKLEKQALERCRLILFPSEWAARCAQEIYQLESNKIKVIPWGANIDCDRTLDDIKISIDNRNRAVCKLLFLGVDWVRKGGDIAFQVAEELNKRGLKTELTIIGCQPKKDSDLPPFVNCLGFLKRNTELECQKFNQLISESHFLILPSRAETYGHVFCEANSFGVPCLATDIAGIPTVIRPDYNGMTFSLDTNISDYCDYIQKLMSNYDAYKKLAVNSYYEYQTRLNWSVTTQEILQALESLIASA